MMELDLVDYKDIAKMYRKKNSYVLNHLCRRPDFPKPYFVGRPSLYHRNEVIEYFRAS